MNNPFTDALTQLARAGAIGGISPAVIERMSSPDKEIRVRIPVTMDDGRVEEFEGYRVQHSNLRGPYKGGVRFHPHTDLDETKALGLWMTIKTAVANIPMGGGKGGVTVDPKGLSERELEELSRGWVRALYKDIGPTKDVPAPDVGTTPQIMQWMVDEYEKLTGDTTHAAFTGKPVAHGGSEGRTRATAFGGFIVMRALASRLGIAEGASVAIQGMGNAGGFAARIFTEHGYRVVAISDSKNAVYDPNGIDVVALEAYKRDHGNLVGFPGATMLSNAELLTLPVDVLVPAALNGQITEANVDAIQAKVILELANGPTSPAADDRLFARGIPVIPDILANSGGVIVSSFEWEQNLKGEHWSEADVEQKMRTILERESVIVFDRAQALSTDLRRGAFVIALERISEALSSKRA